jgi:hypothetical protein
MNVFPKHSLGKKNFQRKECLILCNWRTKPEIKLLKHFPKYVSLYQCGIALHQARHRKGLHACQLDLAFLALPFII